MSNPEIVIAGRRIGLDHPPLVVAEIGINHGGDLEVAKTMADSAIAAGAEVIKHQTHVVEDEMSPEARQVVPGNADISIYEIMQRCALSESDEIALQRHVEERGAIFISTPFSRAAADRLQRMRVPAYKIGSGECNNYPLLEHVAGFGKPVILSTGMNDLEAVAKAVAVFRSHRLPLALLHCTNIYPTPPDLVRLGAMVELAEAFPDCVVGLSDHSTSNYPCLGAVALGASILERHYTDSMTREGPDIVCSMDPQALAALIEGSRVIRAASGGRKDAVAEEAPTIRFAFASVVTTRPVKAGETFNEDNLWVRRPGTGDFAAEQYQQLLGKRAACDILAPRLLRHGDVAV
jgi:N-acetylneuraminate synthase